MKESMNKNEVLSKVTRYDLEREGGHRIFIDVHEFIEDTSENVLPFKFMAVPNFVIGSAKEEYVTTADTAEKALAKCLSKLKGVADFLDVIEQPVSQS